MGGGCVCRGLRDRGTAGGHGRLRRRGLVSRLRRTRQSEGTDRGDRGDADRATDTGWLRPTAASSRTATLASTAPPAACDSTQPIVGMTSTAAATATGSSPATAASSRSATHTSTAPPAACDSRNRSSAWPGPRAAAATGSSRATAASSRSATHTSTAPRAACDSTQADRRHGPNAERQRLLARRQRRRHLHLRQRALPRFDWRSRTRAADHRHGDDRERQRVLARCAATAACSRSELRTSTDPRRA